MDAAVELMRKEQKRKLENFRELNKTAVKGQILFTGSSLMEMFPAEDFLREENSEQIIYNRGIGGFITDDMLRNMNEQIFDLEPSAVFINIGTNDISDSSKSFSEVLSHMLTNYEKIQKYLPWHSTRSVLQGGRTNLHSSTGTIRIFRLQIRQCGSLRKRWDTAT